MHFLNLTDTNVLLFDLGNVIFNIQDEEKWWNETFLPNFHTDKINTLEQAGFFTEYETGKMSSQQFIKTLREIAQKPQTPQQIIQLWNSKLLDIPPYRIEHLRQLSQQYPTYLLSNTNDIHLQYILKYVMKNFGTPVFDEIFNGCVYSHVAQLKKPDRDIYAHTHRIIGDIPKEDVLFFDDVMKNVEGALAYGFQAFQVKKEFSDYLP